MNIPHKTEHLGKFAKFMTQFGEICGIILSVELLLQDWSENYGQTLMYHLQTEENCISVLCENTM